ncbi:hypothetical protein [Flavivirga eckloniae]|uniref:Uncharacterized protein n=1 Tax=Flavivirga eckloniae TaxID=1803846 RepID=A0A2K9PVV3_9FLAO|nr:hypothetical protein [Flavivirga eckloniae]AUP80647.1 hypothetical protein C1H87_18785 [Flavivirga eckloniae]
MEKINTLLLLVFFLLNSCSSTPEFVKLEDLCSEAYWGETIVTEGTLYLPLNKTNNKVGFTIGIKDEITGVKMPNLKIFASVDETKNCMRYLPISYSEMDVKVFDNNGEVIAFGDRIRVTGSIGGADQDLCDLWVEKLEKINKDRKE